MSSPRNTPVPNIRMYILKAPTKTSGVFDTCLLIVSTCLPTNVIALAGVKSLLGLIMKPAERSFSNCRPEREASELVTTPPPPGYQEKISPTMWEADAPVAIC